jgi:hypothetical protein
LLKGWRESTILEGVNKQRTTTRTFLFDHTYL